MKINSLIPTYSLTTKLRRECKMKGMNASTVSNLRPQSKTVQAARASINGKHFTFSSC
jgi:hypothetical protein